MPVAARFWREQQNRYNLIGTECGNCGRIFFPPRDMCVDCHRLSLGKMKKRQMTGRGTVITYTEVHEAPSAFRMQIPYILGIIELDEGPKVTSQIVDCNPNDIKIGMNVQSVFRKISEDGKSGTIHYGYKFKPSL